MHSTIAKIDAEQADFTDPLRSYRDRFDLPDGVLYLDGNSLGALPKRVRQRVAKTIGEEWGEQLIRSWNTADWVHLPPARRSRRSPGLIGAEERCGLSSAQTAPQSICSRSCPPRLISTRSRSKIVSERDNFPTDLYIAQGVAKQIGKGHRPGSCPTPRRIFRTCWTKMWPC